MIKASEWMKNVKIIKDFGDGFLQKVTDDSKKIIYVYSEHDYLDWRNKFFAHVHEAYRRSKREEYYYALHDIDALRQLMAIGWYMEKGEQPNDYGDWAKIEGKRTKLTTKELNLLASWNPTRNVNEILETINAIKPYFKDLCDRLTRKLPDADDERVIETVFNRIEE
jgi:hypothetical protein